jgi:chromosomal replication initiation ATPase DnaA
MNLEQQIEHYKAVRSRLMNAKRAALVMQPQPVAVQIEAELPKRRDHTIKVSKETQESISHILDAYGVTWNELVGPVRETKYILPRRAIWWMLRCKGLSTSQIGAITNRDHTTIINGLKKVNSWTRKQS